MNLSNKDTEKRKKIDTIKKLTPEERIHIFANLILDRILEEQTKGVPYE